MTPVSTSALPDYYGDERRARRRVRVRHALTWAGLIAGLALAFRRVGGR